MISAENARYLNTIQIDNDDDDEILEDEMKEIEKKVLKATICGKRIISMANVYKENRRELKKLGYDVITRYTVHNGETVCLGTTISW